MSNRLFDLLSSRQKSIGVILRSNDTSVLVQTSEGPKSIPPIEGASEGARVTITNGVGSIAPPVTGVRRFNV